MRVALVGALAAVMLTGCVAQMRRQAYVDARPKMDDSKRARILGGKVWIGQTARELRASWGSPRDINRTVTARSRDEQWVYGRPPYSTYVYLEDGLVTSWQD